MSRDYYIGLMSGTSMDGIDAALVRFGDHRVDVAATRQLDYPDELRSRLYSASRAPDRCGLDTLGELDTATGRCFRDAALQLLADSGIDAARVRAIGSHGQTLRHRPDVADRFTLQIGDPAIIASGTGIDTVADFRSGDMALGGQGAPLAPALHEWLFRDPASARVVLNIGGISNISVLPAGDGPVTGCDTGPGNTLLDAWAQRQIDARYDDGGRWAATGTVDEELLQRCLADEWFLKPAPKSTGFEYFNLDWLERAGTADVSPEDVQATLVELTACSVADAILATAPDASRVFVCGGGAHNPVLLDRIGARLPGTRIASTAEAGLGPDWVEAVAFAWLAMRRIEERPGNLCAVTGASRPAVLGALYAA